MLRIAYLNAWGLNCAEPLLAEIVRLAADGVEVFCLTETFDHDNGPIEAHLWTAGRRAFPSAHRAIARALGPQFAGVFSANTIGDLRCDRTGRVFNGVRQGNSVFIDRKRSPRDIGEREIFPAGFVGQRTRPIARRALQHAVIPFGQGTLLLLNFHGIWIAGEGKGGCPEHAWQSGALAAAMTALAHASAADHLLLGADLNLDIDAGELATLEAWSMPGTGPALRNLVREAGLSTTRTPLFDVDGARDFSQVSDHVLIACPTGTHTRLDIGDERVSDHLPLLVTLRSAA